MDTNNLRKNDCGFDFEIFDLLNFLNDFSAELPTVYLHNPEKKNLKNVHAIIFSNTVYHSISITCSHFIDTVVCTAMTLSIKTHIPNPHKKQTN